MTIKEPRSILAIDASPFGRSLALLPVLRAIRAAHPKTFITVAACKGICEILAATGLADESIELGVIKSSDVARRGAVKRLFQLMRRARRYDVDLVLDFSPKMESQILTRLVVRARTLTPSKLPNVADLLFGKRSRREDETSDYASVMRQMKLDGAEGGLAIELPAEENAQFEKFLAKNGSRGGEPIVLIYSAGREGPSAWPVASFGEVGTRLANNFGARIIAADEPADKAFTGDVIPLLPKGAIKLAEPRAMTLAAAVARASLVITDEQGLAQMAADMRTPALEISDGPPQSAIRKSHRIIHGAARARITPDEVYEIACELLQDSRSASLFQR